MRRLILAAFAVAPLACTKTPPPPQGRPADVCAEVKAQVACGVSPENPPPGFNPAANCYDVGNQQFHCGLFEAASRSLATSAQLKPDARTFHALGEALLAQEKWVSAHEAFAQAVEKDPKKRESWVRLAQVRVHMGQPKDAHEAAQKAIALDASRPDALRADAEALAADGKLNPALDALHQAEKLGTPQSQLECDAQEVDLLSLEVRKLEKSKLDVDISAAGQKREAAPVDPELVADLELKLADALDRELALSAAASSTGKAELYRELADARLGAGQLDEAQAPLVKTAQLDPKDFVSERLLAIIRERKGDAPGAREAIAASLKVQPKQAMAYIVLGRLDAAAGDKAAALGDFGAALANEDGKDALETRQLAELAMKVGLLDKAEALYASLNDDPDQSARVDFWLDEAAASAALKHGSAVKAACARAKAIVETATCPPKPEATRR